MGDLRANAAMSFYGAPSPQYGGRAFSAFGDTAHAAFLPPAGQDMAYGAGSMDPALGSESPAARGPGPARRSFPPPGPDDLVGGAAGADPNRPEYFAGMEDMLVYFEGVTCAVVNYSPADTAAIRNELQMLGARVREAYTPECTHLLTPYQKVGRGGGGRCVAVCRARIGGMGMRHLAPPAQPLIYFPLPHSPLSQGRDFEAARHDGRVVVSYAWLEDCLTARRVLPHADKVLYAPIRDEHGVPGMESCTVAVTGYKGPIRNDIRELIEAAGAAYSATFTKKVTHLVCYRAESEVYAKVRGEGGGGDGPAA